MFSLIQHRAWNKKNIKDIIIPGCYRHEDGLKLVIQIPCYNEEGMLGITLSTLPRAVPGVDTVEWLIIDDGSTDRTVEIAESHGADHIVRFSRNRGLAKAFLAGLEASLKAGADIIVNMDADNQHRAEDIQNLIGPILSGKADIVIGARPINDIEDFSSTKKFMQKLGSMVIRMASKTDVPDAPCGFRAISRNAAMQLNVFDEYTYTLETIIQAGQKGMAVTSVPVGANKQSRPSRVMKNIRQYIFRSILTIMRIFMTYRSFRFFAVPGILIFSFGLLLAARFLYLHFTGVGAGHIQSVILSSLLMGTGFFIIVIGLIADLISVNRKLLEKINWKVSMLEEAMQGKIKNEK
jgi:glycosyltransferase involved in cell wall biosynthesis